MSFPVNEAICAADSLNPMALFVESCPLRQAPYRTVVCSRSVRTASRSVRLKAGSGFRREADDQAFG